MHYIEVIFECHPNTEDVKDILASELANVGFESFVNSDEGLIGYVSKDVFSKSATNDVLSNFPLDVEITFTFNLIQEKNWNEEWEKNYFEPIAFENKCIIHSSFHKPEGVYQYHILIDPKMAFGTGHHQTTKLMIEEILKTNFQGKKVLDMGCGTAVLAILTAMLGAKEITAIDIDKWACENAKENIQLNKENNIEMIEGDAGSIPKEKYDVIFANINRNILLNDIPKYVAAMHPNSTLMMSGFYVKDIKIIDEKAKQCGLEFSHYHSLNDWAITVYRKPDQ